MKITKKDLERASEALQDNDMLDGSCDASQVSYALWSALKNIRAEEHPDDHEVVMTVRATVSGMFSKAEYLPGDYTVEITSQRDSAFDMMNPVIEKMEILG